MGITLHRDGPVPFFACDDPAWGGCVHGFSTRLGDIPDVKYGPSPEMAVYSALDAPQAVRDAYLSLLDAGELPELADLDRLLADVYEKNQAQA